MNAQEVAVKTITDEVTIELPIPAHAIIQSPALDGWAMEEIALTPGRGVAIENSCAPPVRERTARIIRTESGVAMARKSVVTIIRVKLHEQRDLSKVVQA